MYVLILVDQREKSMVDHQDDHMMIQYIPKGTQMVGLRFKDSRPTLVIDMIRERSCSDWEGNEQFDKWFFHCVTPCLKKAKYIRHV